MAFDNVLLPLTPKMISPAEHWQDTVATMGGGAEIRNQWWSDPLKAWEVWFADTITLAQFQSARNHYNARRARTRSFPFLDYSDYKATSEAFGTGDGTAGPFQLKAARGDSGNSYARETYLIVPNSETIFVGVTQQVRGTDYTINNATGQITFLSGHFPAGASVISGTWQFYHAARYDMTEGEFGSLFLFVDGGSQLVQTQSIRLVETRDYS